MKRRTKPTNTQNATQLEELAMETFSSDAYLVLNKTLVKELGLVTAAVIANYIDKDKYFRQNQPKNKGWFFLTYEDQQKQLNIGMHSLKKVKKYLVEKDILMTKRRGVPAKEWFKINYKKLTNTIGLVRMKSTGLDNMKSTTLIKENKYKENKNKKNNKKRLIEHFPKDWQQNEKFSQVIEEYEQHRKEKKNTPTPTASSRLAKKLTKYKIDHAIASIERSIEKSWIGVFPENTKKESSPSNKPETKDPRDIIAEYFNNQIQTNHFFHHYFIPAEDLMLEKGVEDSQALIEALINLYDTIGKTQDLKAKKDPNVPSNGEMLERYIDWIEKQDWINGMPPTKLFSFDGKIFKRFLYTLNEEAVADVITGKKYA
jgi:hypothetical protein